MTNLFNQSLVVDLALYILHIQTLDELIDFHSKSFA